MLNLDSIFISPGSEGFCKRYYAIRMKPYLLRFFVSAAPVNPFITVKWLTAIKTEIGRMKDTFHDSFMVGIHVRS